MGDLKQNETIVTCRKCKHRWLHQWVLPMALDLFVSNMQKLVCPSCGASYEELGV